MTTSPTLPLQYLNEASFICGFKGWGSVPAQTQIKVDIAMLAVSLHRNVILKGKCDGRE